MSPSPTETFKKAAAAAPAAASKSKRPAPFPVRLSAEERVHLERKAGSRPLGAYIRAALLNGAEAPRKPTRKPSADHVALGQILGLMGKSEQVRCLFLLLAAAESQRVSMTKTDKAALHQACADMREMRGLLVTALGLRS
jgi:hypothetical protein